eukprot:g493.t1
MFTGCLVGGEIVEAFGRKSATIVAEAAVFLFGGLQAATSSAAVLIWLRTALGVGLGCCSLIKPLYLSEVVPSESRGWVLGIFSFAYSAGLCGALLADELLPTGTARSWRLELALVPMLTSSLLAAAVYWGMDDSPLSHCRRPTRAVSTTSVQHMNVGAGAAGAGAGGGEDAASGEDVQRGGWHALFSARAGSPVGKALRLCLVLVVAYQLTGMALLMSATRQLLERAGLTGGPLSTWSVVTGVCHFVGVGVGVLLLLRLGRRPLFLHSLRAMLVSLAAVVLTYDAGAGAAAFVGDETVLPNLRAAALLLVVISFQLGVAPCFWVITSEVFPAAFRARGMGCVYSLVFVCSVVASAIAPLLGTREDVAHVAFVFCALGAAALVWLVRHLPETRGIELDALWGADGSVERQGRGEHGHEGSDDDVEARGGGYGAISAPPPVAPPANAGAAVDADTDTGAAADGGARVDSSRSIVESEQIGLLAAT